MPECALAVLPAVLQALAPGPEAAAAATKVMCFFTAQFVAGGGQRRCTKPSRRREAAACSHGRCVNRAVRVRACAARVVERSEHTACPLPCAQAPWLVPIIITTGGLWLNAYPCKDGHTGLVSVFSRYAVPHGARRAVAYDEMLVSARLRLRSTPCAAHRVVTLVQADEGHQQHCC